MKYCRLLLIGFVMASGTTAAHAGIFSKHAKIDPAERVPTLIATLRAEQEERKRVAAAEELRQYDPAMFPEIIPSLADAAQRDPKSSVRLEAIQSLAKLRPVSQRAGSALEQATHDESVRVRFQARTLLWQYHLAGYRGGKTPDISGSGNAIRTEEPPLAPPLDANRGSKIEDREWPSGVGDDPGGASTGTLTRPVRPRSSIVDPRSAAASPPIVVVQPPTIGYVAPAAPSAPTANVWGASTPSKTLSSQPMAVPLGPRPLPAGSAQAPPSGPRPLPTGPAIIANNGPKPLPAGPVDAAKPAKQETSKEPPLAPATDDGPDLSPP
jgi:hypothetical protein